MPNQLAGINIRNTNNILFLEIILYRFVCLFTGIINVIIFTNQPGYLNMAGFTFIICNTIITNVCISGNHYLTKIGGVGKNFLVACHAGIKANLAGSGAHLSGCFSVKNSPVSK